MIIQNQDNVAGFAGGMTYIFLPYQMLGNGGFISVTSAAVEATGIFKPIYRPRRRGRNGR